MVQELSATEYLNQLLQDKTTVSKMPKIFLHSERLLDEGKFRKKIFTPAKCPCWGHVFGSEKFEKSEPESGFPPEIFFQKSSIFSNISYRGVSWSDCLPRGVYI